MEKKTEKAAEAAPKKRGVTMVRSVTGGVFRRSVRDGEGNILRTMEIPKEGAFVVETDEDLAALIDDFRTAPNRGTIVEVDENGKPLPKPSAAVEKARKDKEEAAKKRLEAKKKAAEGTPLNEDGTPKKGK